jgi:hypothetical protein
MVEEAQEQKVRERGAEKVSPALNFSEKSAEAIHLFLTLFHFRAGLRWKRIKRWTKRNQHLQHPESEGSSPRQQQQQPH